MRDLLFLIALLSCHAALFIGFVWVVSRLLRRVLGIRPDPLENKRATHICDAPWNGPRS